MDGNATPVPFGDRLRDRLAALGENATQAWLAERSGVDRSLISRLVRNERPPTLDTLQALAPALEIDVAELVAGTDAEPRLSGGADHVRRSDYEAAVGKLIEYEAKTRDLHGQVRSLTENLESERRLRRLAEDGATTAERDLERSTMELKALKGQCDTHKAEVARYQVALQRALAQFSALKTRVEELQRELGQTKATGKLGAILSGIAAAAGVASLAFFFGGDADSSADDEPDNPEDES